MKVSFINQANSYPDILIIPLFKSDVDIKNIDLEIKNIFLDLKKNKLFQGEKGESEDVIKGLKDLPKKIIFIGFGDKTKVTANEIREILAGKMKIYMSKNINKVGIYLHKDFEKFAKILMEALVLVDYTPAKYKTGKDQEKANESLFDEIVVVTKTANNQLKSEIEEGVKVSEAVHMVRDLVNGPPNIINVQRFAHEAEKIAKENGYKITVFDKKALEKMKMDAILNVNRGSGPKNAAKLVVLDYSPKGLKKDEYKNPIVIVGKGLIFDSGGYNLKPYKAIEDMQQDKAGGSVVLGVFKVIKELKIKKRVVGIVPITENLIDAEAYKPSEVINSYSGKTIEIRNTDAEGRLIIADAISYALKNYSPAFLIDIATLTGACIVALGDRYAGVLGNDKVLINKLIKAGDTTDELLWQMPMHRDFKESMKGRIADIRNADDGTAAYAGTSKAAAFLEYFVDKAKWAHIDIAGVAYSERPKPYEQQMATGYGVRMLVEFLKNA